MVTKATRETLSYKNYVAEELRINALFKAKKIWTVDMKQMLQDNMQDLMSKEQQAQNGSFCLQCDNQVINCKCELHHD